MSWAALFAIVNLVALGGWAMLAVLPRGPKVMAVVLYFGVGLLCLAYVAMIVVVHAHVADAGRLPGTPAADFTDYSITGLRNLFLSDAGVVIGWTHYLAFDLFVGQWIAKDADNKGFSRVVQLPFLLLTLLVGPLGLLAWLVVRDRRARRQARG